MPVVTSYIRNIVEITMLSENDFENLLDWTNYLVKLKLEIETLSSTHIRWYTHKNPYGCWICDVFRLLEKWEDIYYPKSPKIDMNQDLVGSSTDEEGVIKSE